MPTVNLLTFRVEKASGCDGAESGGPTRCVQRVEREHGDSSAHHIRETEFLRPRDIIGPRLAEISATYTF